MAEGKTYKVERRKQIGHLLMDTFGVDPYILERAPVNA